MKILLAIEGSKFSEAAIRAVAEQNQPRKTSVRVLHVVEPIEVAYYPDLIPPYPRELSDVARNRIKAGRELAAKAAARLRAAGFQVSATVREGHVRSAIVDAAKKWHANLIVMGSHGRTGLQRLLLGSTSEYVVRHAPCSVQIVRRQSR